MPKDPYQVLGVARDASPADIKQAFRKLARQYHPDVNPNDPSAEEKFKEINEAYSVLSDEERRARFDRFGTTDDVPQDPFAGAGGGLGDLFEMFFGAAEAGSRRGGRQSGRDGEDIRVDLSVSLEEVLTGAERQVRYKRLARCQACSGTGAEGGSQPERCPSCNGTGSVTRVQNTFIGQVRTSTSCPTCRGEGVIISNPCKTCNGRRVTVREEANTVQIPPGVEDGAAMRISGHGSDGIGAGRPGDLYVVIDVADHDRFERRGQDLVTSLELDYTQVALGDRVRVHGLVEDHDIEIPAGTQPGHLFRIRSGGLPGLNRPTRGDLYVEAEVRVPRDLSAREKELLRELATERGVSLDEPEGGLFGGLFKKPKKKK